MPVPVFYQGEAILLRWGDTSSAGRTITLQIESEGERHPFSALKSGASHGQRIAIVAVLIGDNEEPVPHTGGAQRSASNGPDTQTSQSVLASPEAEAQGQGKPSRSFDDKSPAEQAGVRCIDPKFQEWLKVIPELRGTDAGRDIARNYVLAHCKIMSRKELNQDPEAAELWNRMDNTFWVWRREH